MTIASARTLATCSLALLLSLATAIGCAHEPASTAVTPVEGSTPAAVEPGSVAVASSSEASPDPASGGSEVGEDVEAALGRFLAMLDEELPLPPGERDELHEVLTEHAAAMSPYLEAIASQPSRSAKMKVAREHRAEMTAIRERTETRLRALLDEAQYARYEQLRSQLKDELRATMEARYG